MGEVDVSLEEFLDFLFAERGRIPSALSRQDPLFPRAFIDVGLIGILDEINEALSPDDAMVITAVGPLFECVEIKPAAAVIDEGRDVIFKRGAFFFVFDAFVMMVMMMVVFLVIMVIVIVMVVLMLIVVFMIMMVMFFVVVVIVMIIVSGFLDIGRPILELPDPGSACGGLIEIEEVRVDQFIDIDFAVIGFDDLGNRLKGADGHLDLFEFFLGKKRGLVEEDDVAELDLLDDEILKIFLTPLGRLKGFAAAEFVAKAKGIGDGKNRVEVIGFAVSPLHVFAFHIGDGLGDRDRLADAASLDQDVVVFLGRNQIVDLVNEIRFQGAADAAIGKRDEAIVTRRDDASFFYEIGVDVDLADVIDDDRHMVAFRVFEDMVDQRGFAAAKISSDQCNRYGTCVCHCFIPPL